MHGKIIIVGVLLVLLNYGNSYADMFSNYPTGGSTGYNPSGGEIAYKFGGGTLPRYNDGTSTTNIAGIRLGVEANAHCGSANFLGGLESFFNPDAIANYAKGVTSGLVAGAPMFALCYASQTACDLVKHLKTIASAGLKMQQASCLQAEALAGEAGTSLRNASVAKCKQDANGDATAMEACDSKTDLGIKLPAAVANFLGPDAKSYTLSNVIYDSKLQGPPTQQDAAVKKFLDAVLGEVQFSANGISHTQTPASHGMDRLLAELQKKYYDNFVTIVNDKLRYPNTSLSPQDLQAASIPSMPLSPAIIDKLLYSDRNSVKAFIENYSTIAAMWDLLTQMKDIENKLEEAKSESKDPSTIQVYEAKIQKMEREYRLLDKQMDLQTKYLVPAFDRLMNTIPVTHKTYVP